MGRRGKLGIDLEKLETDIYAVCGQYRVLTVRQIFYILVSRFSYPNSLNFYKNYLDRYLTKLRRKDQELNAKFIDPSRAFIVPLRAWHQVELWVEKGTIYIFLSELIQRYRVPAQILRGFGSLSVYRDALKRASEQGVSRILYLGDWDPSGTCIEEVTKREVEIEVVRIALTLEQAKKLPAQPVKMDDTRAEGYIAKFGFRCWEIEALPPEQLLQIVEETLRREIPAEFLRDSELRSDAAKITSEILEPLRERIEAEAYDLLKRRLPSEEIKRRLSRRFVLSK